MSQDRSPASLQAEVLRLQHELAVLKKETSNDSDSEQITVGNYLLARLAQLGVTKMFGVPGDFTLGFLDLVEDHETIDWIGNCNELGAAYAADGYARIKENSLGVVTTTFGVGELSAINGIAGAFSEHVPVLHIAGVPNTTQLKNKPLLHHTLGDGRFDAYTKAAEQFTISQAILMEKASAAAEIDRVLTDCITVARPVYLTLPTDLAYAKISAKRLQIPLHATPSHNDQGVEDFVIGEILKLIHEAEGDAIILVDACAIRHGIRAELGEFIVKSGFPVYAAPMGKTAVSEQYERYGGIYLGSLTHEDIKKKVESAKVTISIGALKSDFNTGNFTYSITPSSTIELHSDHTKVQYGMFPGIGMKRLLPKLSTHLEPFKSNALKISVPKFEALIPKEDNEIISHDWLWPRVSKFFKPKDVIVAETGTSAFGVLDVPLPEGAIFVTQVLWGSIGWTVGSTLGAAMAAKDLGLGRTCLFIGDGSLQLTIQEVSTMFRYGLKPIIFVLNNAGYTVERHLHGEKRKYNDIQNWRWTSLLTVFGGDEGKTCQSYTVHTKKELDALLDDEAFAKADKIQFVEIMMEQMDAPRALKRQAVLSGKTNAYAPAL